MATFQAVILKGNVHIRQDKTTNIKIRVTHNRKSEYISTDLYILPTNFKNGSVRGSNALFINSRIRDELNTYQGRYLKLGIMAKKLTAKELKERILVDSENFNIDFIKFAHDLMKEFSKQGREGTVRGLKGLMSNLEKFSPNLNFQEIDYAFLNSFKIFLQNRGVGNAINNYLRYFRQIFNHGRDRFNDEERGIIRIPNYPFRKFKLEKSTAKTQQNKLSINDLRLFINYKPKRERAQMGKDMFLLMFYFIGINSKDLFFLEPPIDGRITYKRFKTKREYSIKVEPEAIEIIEKYKGNTRLINMSDRYTNPIDFRKYVNKELKEIAEAINNELRKNNKKAIFPTSISTNWARHTWATIARNDCRINKDDVALCLGHEDSDNRVTDIYIKYDYSIIDESNRKVIDAIK